MDRPKRNPDPISSPAWTLIDYSVCHAENGMWYVTRTLHHAPPPGDAMPEDGGIVAERDTKEQAIDAATTFARQDYLSGEAAYTTVFVDGDEHLHLSP